LIVDRRWTMSRLLIVDDSETVLKFLQAIFEQEQYEVVTARDGTEGLNKARHAIPDLIITDSIMPGLDGFALLRALRADPATEMVPVIMLTSGDPHDPDHIVREPRPDVFVKKSADCSLLLAEVRAALERVI
jgi:DNA-binding response OmpR family regulator